MVLWFSITGIVIRLPLIFYLVGRKGSVSAWDLGRNMLMHVPLWAAAYAGARLGMHLTERAAMGWQVAACGSGGTILAILMVAALKPQRESALMILSSVTQIVGEKLRGSQRSDAVAASAS